MFIRRSLSLVENISHKRFLHGLSLNYKQLQQQQQQQQQGFKNLLLKTRSQNATTTTTTTTKRHFSTSFEKENIRGIKGKLRNIKDSQNWRQQQNGQQHKGSLWKWAFGIATVSSVGYYYTHLDYVPITGRRRMITISPEEEIIMGNIACDQLLEQYRGRVISQNHPYSKLVRNVGLKLLTAANIDTKGWDFYVIDSHEVNAFVLPNKKVFVFAGILPVLQDETGMATVLSHEIAHQYARHSAERFTFKVMLTIVSVLSSVFFNMDPQFNNALLTVLFELSYSRKQELEADYIGLLLMASAKYDPRKAIPFWKRMEMVEGGNKTEFLSTHPSNSTRIDQINEHLPEALDIYLLSKSISF